jgi:histone acetyltransferase (RNA polymerase elongator complex component)
MSNIIELNNQILAINLANTIDLIYKLIDYVDCYTDSAKVIEELKHKSFNEITINEIINVINKYSKGPKNRCIECNIDIGENNSRQLCCKTYCPGKY